MPSAHPECAMKVLTLNTWQKYGPWQERRRLIEKEFLTLSPDAAGFQEVFDAEWVHDLRERFPDYFFYYPEPESGLLILSRYPPAEQAMLCYDAQSQREDKRRFAAGCAVTSPFGRFWIFNTHLSWRPSDHLVRQKQTEELDRWCRLTMKDCPGVLVGDFNAEAASAEIGVLTSGGAWFDTGSFLSEADSLTWQHRNPYTMDAKNMNEDGKPLAERRIDFIFWRPSAAITPESCDFRLVFDQPDGQGIWPSDHFGFMAKVAI